MSISDNTRYFWSPVAILFGILLVIPTAVSAETLKIIVQDQNGSAVPEAKVQIGTQEQTTDESGAAIFNDVASAQTLTVMGNRILKQTNQYPPQSNRDHSNTGSHSNH